MKPKSKSYELHLEIKRIIDNNQDPLFGTYDYDGIARDLIAHMAKLAGRQGGKVTSKRGREYYSALGKKGMEKRWGKKSDDQSSKGGEE